MKYPFLITYVLVPATDNPDVRLDAIIDANRYGSKLKVVMGDCVIVVKFIKLCLVGQRESCEIRHALELAVQDLQSAEELWIINTKASFLQ